MTVPNSSAHIVLLLCLRDSSSALGAWLALKQDNPKVLFLQEGQELTEIIYISISQVLESNSEVHVSLEGSQ